MTLEANSSEAMLLLMLSAMHMDGKVVFRELRLYDELARDLGIDDETFSDLVVKAEQEPALCNRMAIDAITDPIARRSIYATMSAIALIDGEFHAYERVLLEKLHQAWFA